MNKLEKDSTQTFDQTLQNWYSQLDAFINTEDKDKAGKDFSAWAAEVNLNYLTPLEMLFNEQFSGGSPVKFPLLDTNPKTKKDDHLKKLKAIRYNIFNYQRQAYLNSMGDLS